MLRTILAGVLLASAPLTLTACKDRAGAQNSRGLITLLDRADAAIAADDMQALFDISTPAPMMDAMLAAQGLTSEAEKKAARDAFRKMLTGMFEQIDIVSHTVEKDSIRYVETDSGATVAYVPMEMVMNAGGQQITSRGEYIGLQRDGEWFLLTPSDDNTIAIIKNAFPELEGQNIRPNTVE